jgi:flagellar biosynthesis/type III secretory pathway M-ring protein FliF/YscJ
MTVAERNSGWIRRVARYAGIVLALFAVAYLLILLPIQSRMAAILQLRPPSASSSALPNAAAPELPAESGTDSPAAGLRRQLAATVREDSEFTNRLIRNWLNEAEAAK